jgi:hypothetical protein
VSDLSPALLQEAQDQVLLQKHGRLNQEGDEEADDQRIADEAGHLQEGAQ